MRFVQLGCTSMHAALPCLTYVDAEALSLADFDRPDLQRAVDLQSARGRYTCMPFVFIA